MKMKTDDAHDILKRLDEDPESVTPDECLVCLGLLFNIPKETLRKRYRNIKEGLPVSKNPESKKELK